MRQIDARRRAEPARLGKTLDAVDAELLAEHIIIHVARMQERLDHIHGTVPPLPPTPESRLPSFTAPVHTTRNEGEMPSLRKSPAIMSFQTEPGGYTL